MRRRNLVVTGALALCAALLAATPAPRPATAQTGCTTNPPAVNNPLGSWPQGATVTVYIGSGVNAAAVQAAFNNWNNVNGISGNNSGVRFQFSSTPVSGPGTFTVNSGQPSLPSGCTPETCVAQASTGINTITSGTGAGTSSAATTLNPGVTNATAITQVMMHEIGHTFGLNDCSNCGTGNSVMNTPPECPASNPGCNLNNTTARPNAPSPCDNAAVMDNANYEPPQPIPCPRQTCGTRFYWDQEACQCIYAWEYTGEHQACPVIIDVAGDGFALTDVEGGVRFDFDSDGRREHISWTQADVDDAWLVLDRNNNGRIELGAELFGYGTVQPPTDQPNGFLALAEYDKPEGGGNADGIITDEDTIFASLRLWQDRNHNGVSETAELHPLPSLGVTGVSVRYKKANGVDQYGNKFALRAKVYDAHGASVGRWAYDVSLMRATY